MTSSEKYSTDASAAPNGVPKFIFSPSTATVVLRKHLHELHPEEYKSVGFLDHPIHLAVANEEVSSDASQFKTACDNKWPLQ